MRHEATGITWRDLKLAAQVFAPPVAPAAAAGLPAVLFIHGWGGFQDANDVALAARLAHVIYEHPVARLAAFRAVQDWLQQHRNDHRA